MLAGVYLKHRLLPDQWQEYKEHFYSPHLIAKIFKMN
jgi:hypothetical protein